MLPETMRLTETKVDYSQDDNAGPLGRVFSSRETSLVSCGNYTAVHGCANKVGFLTGFAVNWGSPTLNSDFNWSNGKKQSWFIGEFYVSVTFMAVFTENSRKTS